MTVDDTRKNLEPKLEPDPAQPGEDEEQIHAEVAP